MEAYCAANVVEKPVVVAAAEVDVELVFCHADGLQADVQDVLCARTEPSAIVPVIRIGGTTCRLTGGSPVAQSVVCWQGNWADGCQSREARHSGHVRH